MTKQENGKVKKLHIVGILTRNMARCIIFIQSLT